MQPRTVLKQIQEEITEKKTFECTREDFFLILWCLGKPANRLETDGRINYWIFVRDDVDATISRFLDPSQPLLVDYRLLMVAREMWRTGLQILDDFKAHRQ